VYWGQTDVVWPPFFNGEWIYFFLAFRLLIRRAQTINPADDKMSAQIERAGKYCAKNDRIYLFIINRYAGAYLK
jgi:hypothetical protein